MWIGGSAEKIDIGEHGVIGRPIVYKGEGTEW